MPTSEPTSADSRTSARRDLALGLLAAFFVIGSTLTGCASSPEPSGPAAGAEAGGSGEQQPPSSRRRRVMLYTKREQIDAPLPSGAPVLVRASGPVSVVEGDLETTLVRASLSATTEERREGVKVSTGLNGEGVFVIEAAWPGGKQTDEIAAFEVRLPRGAGRVEVETAGAVTLSGLGRDAVVRTSNGAVTVAEHRAGVHASTTNAQMSFERVSGVIRAETTNAIVLVRDARGPVSATTSNAAIDLRMAADAAGPVRARTNLGAVLLQVGKGFAGALTMRTSDAPIVLNMKPGAGEVVSRTIDETVVRFGAGQDSTVETTGGTIELRVLDR